MLVETNDGYLNSKASSEIEVQMVPVLKQYLFFFLTMMILAFCGESRFLQYSITLTLYFYSAEKKIKKESDWKTCLTLLIILVHPIIHDFTMYNEGYYRTNIGLDLSLHGTTAFLSYARFQEITSKTKKSQKDKWTSYYLLLNFILCVIAALHALFLQNPDNNAERHSMPWLNIFPTLSVIHFSVMNIFEEKHVWNLHTLIESLFCFTFFVLLVLHILPIGIFMRMQIAEHYFVCSLFASSVNSKESHKPSRWFISLS